MAENFEGMGDADITEKNITLIDPTLPSGTTTLLLGGSYTAKTSLLVQSLYNLLRDFPDRFNAIVLMTESISAQPLQHAPPQVILLNANCPEILRLMVIINQATNKRYGFLAIFDDCLSLRGADLTKAINIWRNSGLSTIISTQYPMFVSPSMRSSFHNIFITGARTPEVREKVRDIFLRGHLKDRLITDKAKQDEWIIENTKLEADHRKVIRVNGITERMFVHRIRKPL